MSKLRQRLEKMGSIKSSLDKGRNTMEKTMDSILEDVMKEAAKEIRFDYDDGVFTLATNNPKYIDIKNCIDMAAGTIQSIAEEWKKDTEDNYKKNNY